MVETEVAMTVVAMDFVILVVAVVVVTAMLKVAVEMLVTEDYPISPPPTRSESQGWISL